MFRRHWSGLPKDVTYPADLENLGYFINEEDEIRSIENPDNYFRAFPNRNDRINHRRRFAFDYAIEKIIEERLENEGLKKTPLPLGTPSSEKHVPVFMTPGLDKEKRRVVIFFGEPSKPLGLLAGRVANGRGGVNKGSLVSVVKYLHGQALTEGDSYEKQPPGIIIANVGQLYWYPNEKRALTIGASDRIGRRSLVDSGRKFAPDINGIEGHETPMKHIAHLFEKVLPTILHKSSKIEVIAVGDTCEKLQMYLDQESVWDTWGKRMSSMVLMSTLCPLEQLQNGKFKNFLAKRARNYILCQAPLNMPVAPPTGNDSIMIPPLGVPSYSSAEPDHVECILITAMEPILDYLMHNALNPEAENEHIEAVDYEHSQLEEEEHAETQEAIEAADEEVWKKVADEEKPGLTVLDQAVMDNQRKVRAGWEEFEATGQSVAKEAMDDEAN